MEKMLKHISHEHSLILEENYQAEEGDVCRGCNRKLFSCKLFVYTCSDQADDRCERFRLHKSCAELPPKIEHPGFPEGLLFFHSRPSMQKGLYPRTCNICNMRWDWFIYCSSSRKFNVCVKCAMLQLQSLEDRKFDHPAHSQHQLTLVQHLASFECHACKVDDDIKDLSYICTKCPFWMHKSCAHAPTSFQTKFHLQHPLILSYSLPQIYQKFDQYCRVCNEKLNHLHWLYFCPKCRFFAHFHCARSNPTPSQIMGLYNKPSEVYYSNVVHLPAEDESSVNLLFEQFVKALSTLNNKNHNSISSATKGNKHWTHEHDLQLITINELNDRKDDDETSLLCDGCVKPIRTDGGLFFGCVPCQYFLHKMCAESPTEIEHHLWPGNTLHAGKDNEQYKFFYCEACGGFCNGIFFCDFQDSKTDIGCVVLPKIIKHEAHHHQLGQVKTGRQCKACGSDFIGYLQYECEKDCYNFYICVKCIMQPKTVKHRWHPHPLRLIYESGMVSDHEHDFNCEYCSGDIDTNLWFYHCSDCDISFHIGSCFEFSSSLRYSKMKFGATNIVIDELHPHSLTLAKNRKVRNCESCDKKVSLGCPVLECAPCKTIFCYGTQHGQYLGIKKSKYCEFIFLEGSTYFFNEKDFSQATMKVLGEGSYGTTYKVVMDEGPPVVAKRLNEVGVAKKEFEQQMEILGKISRHPNIVPLLAYYYSEFEKYLFYEYMPARSLSECLHGNRGTGRASLDWDSRLKIALGATRGIAYIHALSSVRFPHGNIKSSNVLHGTNIKSSNVLHGNRGTGRTSLDWESRLKIALGAAKEIAHRRAERIARFTHGNIKSSNVHLNRDLDGCVSDAGLAPLMNYIPSKHRGTGPGYRAPEMIETRKATQKSDVYSFGVLLLEMLTGKSPIQISGHGNDEIVDLPRWVRSVVRKEWTAKVLDVELMKYQNIEEELVEMLQIALACVEKEPDMRLSMDEVVKMIEEIRQCDSENCPSSDDNNSKNSNVQTPTP